MKISIAMATYNGEKYIKKQLQSIFAQSVLPDEMIICDDCSSDETMSVIEETIRLSPQASKMNIQVIRNTENLGYIENFKKAVSMTTGDCFFLADQDDIWEVNKLERMVTLLETQNCQGVFSSFSLMDGQDQVIDDWSSFLITSFMKNVRWKYAKVSFGRLVLGNVIQGCMCCFRGEVRELLKRIDDRELYHDHQLILLAARLGKVLYVNEPLVRYRLHDHNTLGFTDEKTAKDAPKDFRIHHRTPVVLQFLQKVKQQVGMPHYLWYAFLCYLRIPFWLTYFNVNIDRYVKPENIG